MLQGRREPRRRFHDVRRKETKAKEASGVLGQRRTGMGHLRPDVGLAARMEHGMDWCIALTVTPLWSMAATN